MVHERVELRFQSPGEDGVRDDRARLDVPLVGSLGEVGRGDEGPVFIDDDALGVEAGPLLPLAGKGPRVVEDIRAMSPFLQQTRSHGLMSGACMGAVARISTDSRTSRSSPSFLSQRDRELQTKS